MVGLHVEMDEETKQTLIQVRQSPFVLLGNHSYSHANNHYQNFYSNAERVVEDMEKANTILSLSGQSPIYSRLPGRDVFRLPNGLKQDDPYISSAEDQIEKLDFNKVYADGFYLYRWDLEWAHYASGKPIQSIDTLMTEIDRKFENNDTFLPNKLVLLMHDQMFQNHLDGYTNFKALVKNLKAKGYQMKNVCHYHEKN